MQRAVTSKFLLNIEYNYLTILKEVLMYRIVIFSEMDYLHYTAAPREDIQIA